MTFKDHLEAIETRLKVSEPGLSFSDFPSLPFTNLNDIKVSSDKGQLTIISQYASSSEALKSFNFNKTLLFSNSVGLIPYILMITAGIAAIATARYLLLITFITNFIAMMLSSPAVKKISFFIWTIGFVSIYGLISYQNSISILGTLAFLSWLSSVLARKIVASKIVKIALASETIFLVLYKNGIIGVKTRGDNKIYLRIR